MSATEDPQSSESVAAATASDAPRASIGPVSGWPRSLRTLVGVLNAHPLPMVLLWGPNQDRFDNDAFTRIAPAPAGDDTLSQGPHRSPATAWPVDRSVVERVLTRGEAVVVYAVPRPVEAGAGGQRTSALFDVAYGPARDDDGRTAGVLLTLTDTTPRGTAERGRDPGRADNVDVDRAVEALRASEQTQRALIEQSAAGIAQTDLNGRIVFANLRYCQITGYSFDELLGRRVHDLTHPDDLPTTTTLVAEGAATGHEYAMEKRYVRKDGSVVWVAVSASILKDASGRPRGIIGVVIDIDARKAAERAVRESESRFRQLADAMPQMVFSAGPDGHVDYFNHQWYEYTGLPEGEVGFESWRHVHTEEGLRRATEVWPAAVRDGTPYELEYQLRRHDGEYRWHLGRAVPVRDEGGRVVRWFGTNTDIHDRKLAEAALRAGEERYRALFERAAVGMAEVDLDGRFLRVNAAYGRITGRAPEELVGRYVSEITHPDDVAPDDALRAATIRSDGATVRREKRYVRQDGAVVWVDRTVTLVHDEQGRPSRLIASVIDVTPRKQAEAARAKLTEDLERQARLFDAALSSVRDYFVLHDRDGRAVYANRVLLDLWDTAPEQARGRTLAELGYNPRVEAHLLRDIRRVFDTGRPVAGETPFRSVAGVDGHYEYIFAPVLGPSGAVELVAGTARDVSVRRRQQQELEAAKDAAEENLARWRAAVGSMAEGVVVADAEGNLPEWNAAALEMHGYASIDEVRRHLRDFPEVLELTAADGREIPLADWPMSRVLRGETFSGYEVTIRRRDADLRRVISYGGSPVLDRDGRVALAVLTLHDVTEERRAQAAVRESEERLRLAITIARLGTFQIDLLNDAVIVNETGRAIYGWPAGEPLTFAKVQAQFHPEDRDRVVGAVAEALAPDGPGEFAVEQRIIRTDGAVRWIRVRGQAVFDHEPVTGRRAVRCVGTYLDVTEQKEAERQREALLASEQAARAEAERANEAKNEFLATLSHELRTPLTPVLLTVSLLESHPGLPADLRDEVETIRRNVELESRLISDLLDLTRIAKGKLQLQMQDVDLHTVVRAAVDICRAGESAATLAVDLRAARHVVRGDPTRLQQVVWNLVNNAQKFTPSDGTIRVTSTDLPDGRVRVEVSDTGVGIDAGVIAKLFDAFEQGEARAASQHAGLGLGLAITKRLVEAHGGTVTAASPGRGRGATFTIDLPVEAQSASPRPPSPTDTRPRPTPPAAGPSLRVLLVEDHEESLRVLEKLLRRLGHDVTPTTSVATAAAAIERESAGGGAFDVIVSDVGLPDGTGVDLLRRFGAQYAGRAIALTGYGMDADVAATRAAGFAEHLTKPVDLTALTAALNRVAERPTTTSRVTAEPGVDR